MNAASKILSPSIPRTHKSQAELIKKLAENYWIKYKWQREQWRGRSMLNITIREKFQNRRKTGVTDEVKRITRLKWNWQAMIPEREWKMDKNRGRAPSNTIRFKGLKTGSNWIIYGTVQHRIIFIGMFNSDDLKTSTDDIRRKCYDFILLNLTKVPSGLWVPMNNHHITFFLMEFEWMLFWIKFTKI